MGGCGKDVEYAGGAIALVMFLAWRRVMVGPWAKAELLEIDNVMKVLAQ